MKTKVLIFKVRNGQKAEYFELNAISDNHAIVVAEQFKERNGLIGRYYCETSNGFCFSV